MTLKFSLVTPSFNQVNFVKDTLKSVSEQTVAPFEHIIVDGGSTDGTLEIHQDYGLKNKNVQLIVGKDKNQTDAINIGFEKCTGDIITWLNTDDTYISPLVIEKVISFFEANPSVDIIYGKGKFYDVDDEFIKDVFVHDDSGDLKRLLMTGVGILQPALFMRRSVFKKVGKLVDSLQYSMDYDYWLKCCHSNCKFKFVNEYFAKAILHDDSKTVGGRVQQLEETCNVVKGYYGFYPIQWVKKLFAVMNYNVDGLRENNFDDFDEEDFYNFYNCMNSSKEHLEGMLQHDYIGKASLGSSALYKKYFCEGSCYFATAFDSEFFESGLTLLSSLNSDFERPKVIVYDLGLTSSEKDLVRSLDFVLLLSYPKTDLKYFEGYFDPRTYGFKIFSMYHLNQVLPKNTPFIWIDAGIVTHIEPERAKSIIDKLDIFLVDHDDKPGWPFYNVTMTSDDALINLGIDHSHYIKPHLRAGIIGFKAKGKYEKLINEAMSLSLNPKVLVGEKHPNADEKLNQSFGSEREALIKNPLLANQKDKNQLRKSFGYWGHRHDQTIFSALASKYDAPYQSAKQFCFAPDVSSALSKQRWEGTQGKNNQKVSALAEICEGSNAAYIQHRGIYLNFDKLFYKKQHKSQKALILGNGPSLSGWNFAEFEGLVTFGMNAAYRYWDQINWYPDYYICLDLVVGFSHKDEIKRLINNSEKYGISKFLLRKNVIDQLAECENLDRVICFDDCVQDIQPFNTEYVTTGSHCLAWAVSLGFEDIGILGVDCDYVELVAGAASLGGMELVISEDCQSNPNYFFDGYQKKGDKYNVPNPGGDIHIEAWRQVNEKLINHNDINIINLNYKSKVDCFAFGDLVKGDFKLRLTNELYLAVATIIIETKAIFNKVIIGTQSKDTEYFKALNELIYSFDNEDKVIFSENASEVSAALDDTLLVMICSDEIIFSLGSFRNLDTDKRLVLLNLPINSDQNQARAKSYNSLKVSTTVCFETKPKSAEQLTYCAAKLKTRLDLLSKSSQDRIREQGVKFTYVRQEPAIADSQEYILNDKHSLWMLFKGHVYNSDSVFCKVDLIADLDCKVTLSLKRHGTSEFEESKITMDLHKDENKTVFIKKQFASRHEGVRLHISLANNTHRSVKIVKFNAECFQIPQENTPKNGRETVKNAYELFHRKKYSEAVIAFLSLSSMISDRAFDYNIYKCLKEK